MHDGRGEALWNAAAELAHLTPWGPDSVHEFCGSAIAPGGSLGRSKTDKDGGLVLKGS